MCHPLTHSIVPLYSSGNLVCYEQHETGIEAFPASLEKLFNGGHVGRLLVDIAAE